MPFELREKGFEHRRQIIRFSDLSSIRFGLPRSKWQNGMLAFSRLLAPISRHARSALRTDAASQTTSLTLVFQDGSTRFMKGFLSGYEVADMDQVFDYIRSEHPDLLA